MDWPVEAVIRSSLMNAVIDAGDKSPTEEICGALLGYKKRDIWEIKEFIPLTNISPNKVSHYIPDQNEWITVLKKTTFLKKDAKMDLIGVFHTHPHSAPTASITDINEAGYEGIYWIYSPALKTHAHYYWDGNEDNRQFTEIKYKIRK